MELPETLLLHTIMGTGLAQGIKTMMQQAVLLVATVHSISKVLGGTEAATIQVSMVSTIMCLTQSSVLG